MTTLVAPSEAPIEARWRPPAFATHPAKRPKVIRRAICEFVTDGDTFDLLIELGGGVYSYERIRLAKVDCPEIFSPKSPAELALGQQAKMAVLQLILNQPVLVDLLDESQVQNRYIATVQYTQDGGKTWKDLGAYLTDHHLLKKDVV